MDLKRLNDMLKLMESNLKDSDKPCVGMFWYSPARVECFGVVKAKEGDDNYVKSGVKGMCTCKELHEYYWKREYHRYKYHPELGVNLFIGSYVDKPRGRIFYNIEENLYYIMTGSWINDYPEARECILREFNLNGFQYTFQQSRHWDIGVGFNM